MTDFAPIRPLTVLTWRERGFLSRAIDVYDGEKTGAT